MANASDFTATNPADFTAAGPAPSQSPDDYEAHTSRGPLGEIASQFKAGALVDVPGIAAKAVQRVATPGGTAANIAARVQAFSDKESANPDLQAQPDEHSGVTNALASAARVVPTIAAPIAAAMGVSALAPEAGIGAAIAPFVGAAAGATPFALAAGQETYEKGKAEGVSEDEANAAANQNALVQGGLMTLAGPALGKVLAGGGGALARALGRSPTVASTLADYTAPKVAAPFLKSLPEAALTNTALFSGQAGAGAAIEQAHGIQNMGQPETPGQAALEQVPTAIAMTTLMGPLAALGMGRSAMQRAAAARALADPTIDPARRQAAADQVADSLRAVHPDSAGIWSWNADQAIRQGKPVEITPEWTTQPHPDFGDVDGAPAGLGSPAAGAAPGPAGAAPEAPAPDEAAAAATDRRAGMSPEDAAAAANARRAARRAANPDMGGPSSQAPNMGNPTAADAAAADAATVARAARQADEFARRSALSPEIQQQIWGEVIDKDGNPITDANGQPVAAQHVSALLAAGLPADADTGGPLTRTAATAVDIAPEQHTPPAPAPDEAHPVQAAVTAPPDLQMQNRDRSRPASIAQMNDIASNPDYDRLGAGKSPNDAAPMVSVAANVPTIPETDFGNTSRVVMADGSKIPVRYAVVEAPDVLASHNADGSVNGDYFAQRQPGTIQALNNGRVAGLQEAYKRGTAEQYKTDMLADAPNLGIDPAAIEGKKNPILVRVYDDKENQRPNIGALSNPQVGLDKSAPEQAHNDAVNLDATGIHVSDDGSIINTQSDPALKKFLAAIPADEHNKLVSGSGYTKQFEDRVRSALFAKAYGNADLVSAATEQHDPDIKNVLNAMTAAAPEFAKVEHGGPLDIRPAMVEAAQMLRDARSRGIKPADMVSQMDMFGREPMTQTLAGFMAENSRSPNRMAAAFSEAARFLQGEKEASTSVDMFARAPATMADLAARVNAHLEKNFGPDTKIRLAESSKEQPKERTERVAESGSGTRAAPADGVREPGAEQGAAAGAPRPAKPEVKPPLELKSESNDEILAKAAAKKTAADKKAADDKAADDKAKADAQRSDFALAGSDRTADVNANQADLLATPAKPAEKPAAKPATNEDVGQNLWFNRRNFTGKGIEWKDVAGLNDTLKSKEVVKQKVWPKPDYEGLVEAGMHPLIARVVKQVYDGIAISPGANASDEKLQRYIAAVQKVRDGVFSWAKDSKATAEFGAALGEAAKNQYGTRSLLTATPFKDAVLKHIFPEEMAKDPRARWKGEALNEMRVLGANRALQHLQVSLDDALKHTKAIKEGWPAKQESWQSRYRIVEKDGEFRVLRKNQMSDMGTPLAKEATEAAAIDKARELAKVQRNADAQDIRGTNVGDSERTGPAFRGADENVSSERLMSEFGFRGVNFGSKGYINDAERQAYVNAAYDGMRDLADILNVPAKALSLNGELGIAFGAQGRGGHAAAHFVPGVNEINLTKTMGSGTFAHEFGHALDHYFATKAGLARDASPFLSAHADLKPTRDRYDTTIQKTVSEARFAPALRHEVLNAFAAIKSAMDKKMSTAMDDARQLADMRTADLLRVNSWLRAIEANMRPGDPAKIPEYKAKFEALADRVRAGDVGAGATRMGNMQLPDVIAQIRALGKETGGRLEMTSNMRGLVTAAMALKFNKDRTGLASHPIRTEYAKESSSKDGAKKGKPYWSTPHEMFARAFERYISSKLEAKAQSNTFLSDAHERAVMPNQNGAGFAHPYPRGDELEAINKAFDTLVSTLKTTESEGRVALNIDTGGVPAFYSALQKSLVEKAPFAKDGTVQAAQLRAWLLSKAKEGMFKNDELQWSGLTDYLELQKGKVSRADVENYMRENGVQVEDTTLGNAAAGERVRFAKIQLPGGENYRELLLTLPTKVGAVRDATLNALDAEMKRRGYSGITDEERQQLKSAGNGTFDMLDDWESRLGVDVGEARYELAGDDKPDVAFRSDHFDQPNVLAHIRFNDRTDADGKKVLFLEELQSDWAQKGRKQGFAAKQTPEEKEKTDELKKTIVRLRSRGTDEADRVAYFKPGALIKGYSGTDKVISYQPGEAGKRWSVTVVGVTPSGEAKSGEFRRTHSTDPADTMVHGLEAKLRVIEPFGGSVPPAPFVGKTEAWVALALKRMIRYGAENGYDRVAWTNGEQQAERYDLSKQVNNVEAWKDGPGTYSVQATGMGRSGIVLDEKKRTKEQLAEIVGKDVADKIVQRAIEDYESVKLSGVDLKVGGEGMRAFYDKIVPNIANDVLKKLGGGRVGSIDISGHAEPAGTYERTRVLPENGAFVAEGFVNGHWQTIGDDFPTRLAAEQAVGAKPMPQPGFDITPAMRDKAMAGQPLFSKESLAFSRPNPVDVAASGKALVDPGSIPEAKGLFDKPSAAIADLRDGKALDLKQKWGVAAALKDLFDLGFPKVALDGMTPFHIQTTGDGTYYLREHSIGLSGDIVDAAAGGNASWAKALRGMLAHEFVHHLDNSDDVTGVMSSAQSPRFAMTVNDEGLRMPTGDIIKEAFNTYLNGSATARSFLRYPFLKLNDSLGSSDHTEMLQTEVFAQLGRAYYTNPAMLKAEFPKAFDLWKDLNDGLAKTDTIDDARAEVQRALQDGDSGRSVTKRDLGRGTASEARASAESERAGARVEEPAGVDSGEGPGADEALKGKPGPDRFSRNAEMGREDEPAPKGKREPPKEPSESARARANTFGYTMYQDVKDRTRGGLKASILDAFRKLFAPSARGAFAKLQAGLMRANLGRMAREAEVANTAFRRYAAAFSKLTRDEQIAFTNRYERGETQPTAPLREAAEAIKAFNDQLRSELQRLGKLEDFNENYLGRIWLDPEDKVNSVFARRPLEGSKGFLKRRVYEYFSQGLAAGLRPITYNPIEMMLLKGVEQRRFIYAQKIMGEMRAADLIREVAYGNKAPDGWGLLNDKVGRTPRGQLYAPEEAATLFNNYLSPGLRGNAAYDMFHKAGMMLNSAQLGLSLFHAGFTTIDSLVSKASLGIQQLSRGQFLKGFSNVAQALNPAQPFLNAYKGDRLLRSYLGQLDDPSLAPIVEALVQGGGRVRMDEFYRNSTLNSFKDALARNDALGIAKGLLPSILDRINAPIFEQLVPRQKLGIFFDMAKDWLERNPNATLVQKREAMGKFWDSVDNRLGQLAYDNVFWNRTLKDMLMVTVRSVGWNLGTFRELGGGVLDARHILANKELSSRSAYVLALPFVTGIMGSMIGYMYTGKGPEDLKDYFFPKTGRTRPDGSDDRVSLPSYMKDVYEYGHDISGFLKYGSDPTQTLKNKLHPLIGMVAEMLNNQDFFGGAIRSPGDPAVQQLEDEAKYLTAQLSPFGIRNFAQQQKVNGKSGFDPLGYLTSPSMVGITPSPGYITKNDKQTEAAALSRMKDSLIVKFREEIQNGATPADVSRRAFAAGLRLPEIHTAIKEGMATRSVSRLPPRHLAANE